MRLAPRPAVSLPLTGLFVLAQATGHGTAAATLMAASAGAWLAPARRAPGVVLAALAAGGAMLLAVARPGGAEMALAALPLLGNLLLAWHFGRTLRPGEEALIARYTRAAHGALPPGVAGYTWWLTFGWTAFFLAFSLLAVSTLAGAGPAPGPAAVANAGLSAAFFLGEHVLRGRLFPGLGPARPWRTIRAIWRVDAAADAR